MLFLKRRSQGIIERVGLYNFENLRYVPVLFLHTSALMQFSQLSSISEIYIKLKLASYLRNYAINYIDHSMYLYNNINKTLFYYNVRV